MQYGFRRKKSTTDAIFMLPHADIQEKNIEKNSKLYHVFVDQKKACDKVPREECIECEERKDRQKSS